MTHMHCLEQHVTAPTNFKLIPPIREPISDVGADASWFVEAAFPTHRHRLLSQPRAGSPSPALPSEPRCFAGADTARDTEEQRNSLSVALLRVPNT
jgi:hypothetical protein